MIKSILSILLTFITLYFVGLYTHTAIIESKVEMLPFSLQKLYLFHAGFSILICVNLQLLSVVDKISNQLGFVYLGTLFLKILVFSAAFYQSIIKEENLALTAKISILIPIFIFLLTEVFFVSKILNTKS